MTSVCVATYNGSNYIIRQINSILPQLNSDDEIIVSDDNSTDDTRELLLSINDNRIKLVLNQSKRGPIGNFENALKHATGNYILLADQDDVWLSNKVSIMAETLANYDLVLTNCEVVNGQLQTIIPSFFSFRGSKPGFWHNLYKNSYIGCCMGFRREILTYVVPIPATIHMHDWWIGLLVELNGSVKFIPQSLMKYVRHGSNLSPTGELSTYSIYERLKNRLIMVWYLCRRFLR